MSVCKNSCALRTATLIQEVTQSKKMISKELTGKYRCHFRKGSTLYSVLENANGGRRIVCSVPALFVPNNFVPGPVRQPDCTVLC